MNIKIGIKNKILLLFYFFIIINVFLFWEPWLSADGYSYYAYLPSIYLDRDLDLTNQYKYNPYRHTVQPWSEKISPSGKPSNLYYIGMSILWAPFFIFGHGVVKLINFIIPNNFFLLNGYSTIEIYFISIAQLFYLLMGLFFTYKFLKIYFNKINSLLAIILIFFQFPLFYYTLKEPFFSHTGNFFIFSLLIYYWKLTENRDNIKIYIIKGFLLGLCLLIRPDNIVIIFLFLYDIFKLYKIKKIKEILKYIFIGILTLFLVTSSQMIIWKVLWLKFLPVMDFFFRAYKLNINSYAMVHKKIEIIKPFFNLTSSIFISSPISFIALIGFLLYSIKSKRRINYYLMISFVFLILIVLFYNPYASGIGGRYYTRFFILFAIGLAFILNKFKKLFLKFLLVIIAGLFIIWHQSYLVYYRENITKYQIRPQHIDKKFIVEMVNKSKRIYRVYLGFYSRPFLKMVLESFRQHNINIILNYKFILKYFFCILFLFFLILGIGYKNYLYKIICCLITSWLLLEFYLLIILFKNIL